MRWLALEAGDAATWGSTVVTFGMACFAIAQGIGQRRELRRQNELQAEASQLQRRQIETAERRTLVMEQLLAQLSAGPVSSTSPLAQQDWGEAAPVQRTAHVPGAAAAPSPRRGADAVAGASAPEEVSEPAEEFEPQEEFERPGDFEPAERAEPQASELHVSERALRTPSPAAPPQGGAGYGYPQQPPQGGGDGYAQQPVGQEVSYVRQRSYGQPPTYVQPPSWSAEPSAVWRLERVGRHTFALRNTGSSTLTGVHVSRGNLPASAFGVPENAVVRPGETAEFMMAAGRGDQVPDVVLVSWSEHPDPVRVPLPQS